MIHPHSFLSIFIMATRSRIGIELKDGSILSAYHHWDGYPQWLGRILNTHYNTKTKVVQLIDGGDMSVAGLMMSSATLMAKLRRKQNMVLSIILSVVKTALLVMITTWKSSSLMVKNMHISSATMSG